MVNFGANGYLYSSTNIYELMKKITTVFVYFLAMLILVVAGCKKKKKDEVSTSQNTNDKIKKILVSGVNPQQYYFSYNDNGVLTQIIAKGVGDWDTTQQLECHYTFGTNNNLVSATASYNDVNDGPTKLSYVYNYDSQNRLVSIQGSENDGGMYDIARFIFSDNNKIEVHCHYDDTQGKYVTDDSTIYYSYDSFGNPDSSDYYFYVASSSFFKQSRYTYNGSGNLIKKEDRQPSVSTSWTSTSTCEYETGNASYYPKELFYFVLILGDDEDILDPTGNLLSPLPNKEIDDETCNSASYSLTTNSTYEKDSKGRLIHMTHQGQELNYSDCSTINNNDDWTFYY